MYATPKTVYYQPPHNTKNVARFKIFTAVTILIMFFRAEDGESTLLRNSGVYQATHTVI
jgi:hypothetical protein